MSSLDIDLIRQTLKTNWLAQDLQFVKETLSTNNNVEKLGRSGGRHGLTIIADSQSGGRGRFKRTWYSPPGVNLYFSFLLIPKINKKNIFKIPSVTLVAAVALHEAISKLVPNINLGIKWPNDILCSGKKVAGILTEYHQFPGVDKGASFLVLGIGLNVNVREFPKELKNLATSLAIESSKNELSREALFSSICNYFEKWYDHWSTKGLEEVTSYWVKNSGMLGKSVVTQGKSGVVLGLSESGALLIEGISGEIIEVASGEVEITSH